MRLYLFAPTFYLRPHNTDWLYTRSLPQIKNFTEGLEIYLQQAWLPSLVTNVRLALSIAQSRLPIRVPQSLLPVHESYFSRSDVRRSGADVIYGHSPVNVPDLPLICHTGPIFEEAMRQKGVPEQSIEHEKAVKRGTIRRSQLVTLNSETGADTIRALDPDSAWKIRSLPFFLPHLKLISWEELERKYADLSTIRLLFVGREARRKGLPAVLQAFQAADARYPGRLALRVVTTFAGGAVEVPQMRNLQVQGETDREQVQQLMRESHILLMPSRFESFGWVYLEAMAAGTIAVAPNALTQREILDNGNAGILVQPDEQGVTEGLLKLLARPEEMVKLAEQGWMRVKDHYEPHAVAEQMKSLGNEAMELFRLQRKQA